MSGKSDLCQGKRKKSRCTCKEFADSISRASSSYLFFVTYTDHAGLEISVNSGIAWPFSWQIAIGNAGPSSALEPLGAKRSFRCHLLNIAPIYKQ